jgi:acetyl-CoA carboxylase biotin carboxylase subunit
MKKILILNRGEIALRIIRTCLDLNIHHLLVYSKEDESSLPVKLAKETFCLGEGPSSNTYLNQDLIIEIAFLTGCDALHPGYGFLSENVSFAQKCKDHQIIFIGPNIKSLKIMGDKLESKKFAIQHNIPVLQSLDVKTLSPSSLKEKSMALGFPLLIKASGGGGGKGMQKIENLDELFPTIERLKKESLESFGTDALFIEKYIENPRHIEVQILGDKHGNIIHLGTRDCSIQRKFQKIIEEAPATILENSQLLYEKSLILAKAIEYESAGTLEFLYDQKEKKFYFMEMNTRIQVEHTVTEEITHMDLIAWQIFIAENKVIPKQEEIVFQGHAIELRINAENSKTFFPSPKNIEFYHPPGGLGVRVDDFIYNGYTISPFYDSLIAKIIIKGKTRNESIQRSLRALEETFISGPDTNINLHKNILQDEDFKKNTYSTAFLQEKISSFEL